MGLWKRRRGRVEYLTPAQMLETLALLRVRALLAHGAVWVAADRGAATALDLCCVGALEGGPATAAWVAGLVGATRSAPDALAGGAGGGAEEQEEEEEARDGDAQAPAGGGTGGGDAAPPPPPPRLAGVAEAGGVSAARLRAVRLSPEEAMFLAHVLAPALSAYELVEGEEGGQEGAAAASTARPASLAELWRWCCRAGGAGGEAAAAAAATTTTTPTTTRPPAAAAPPDDPLLAATVGREGRGDGLPQSPTLLAPFPYRYAAYCHLRAKGWLPRGGLLYGADFVLYALHPALVHSEYVAVVLPLERRGPPPEQEEEEAAARARLPQPQPPPATAAAVAAGAPRPPPQANAAGPASPPPASSFSQAKAGRRRGWWAEGPGAALRWVDAQIAQRLARQVFKQLLLLHVALPLWERGAAAAPTAAAMAAAAEALGPDAVLARGAVRETVARRWVPPAGGGVAQALAEAAVAAGGAEGPLDD